MSGIPDEPCALSQRSDGDHSWQLDGDDPYIRCMFCGEVRDALSGRGLTGPDPLLAMMARAEVMVPESAVAEAVAAERERIIAKARELGATYDERSPCNCGRADCTALIRSSVPFADYLEDA